MKGSTYKAPSLAAFEKFSTMYGITAGDDRQTRPALTLPCASGFKSLSRLFGLRRRHWLMAHDRPKKSWIFAILRLETGSTSIKISEGKTTAGDLKKMQRQRQAWMLKYMRAWQEGTALHRSEPPSRPRQLCRTGRIEYSRCHVLIFTPSL